MSPSPPLSLVPEAGAVVPLCLLTLLPGANPPLCRRPSPGAGITLPTGPRSSVVRRAVAGVVRPAAAAQASSPPPAPVAILTLLENPCDRGFGPGVPARGGSRECIAA
jgi:hypothetical protein